ncbi:MAG: alpha/beta hydrolase [Bacteroidetes bacterium]|nr:alpha/beta hydrolase [Bacteroidota bacterium]
MKKILAFLLLFTSVLWAQVTLKVTSIPANTPANSTIYLAGSVNNWNPADSNYTLQPDGLGNWQIVLPQSTGTVEYKFTRGSWATVEGNATGSYLPNRSFTYNGSAQTINLTIQSWEDLGSGNPGTTASNVQILSNSFGIPQLSTTRRIWLYLPPDYTTSSKHYPVLYMQDGQNLFDNQTSFSGEWQVDETLNSLFNQGDYGAIVVGIDNGGANRLNEYSPWVNAQYGGGQGDAYMQFLTQTLKPYIDANYRTRTEPSLNALIGSSMGGLIATYGACAYPNAFQKVGSMSPAYWFCLNDLNSYINNSVSGLQNHRFYFVSGTNESSSMVPDINTIKNNLTLKGLTAANTRTKFDSYGVHSESYWRGEFGALYQWLFAGENLSTNQIKKPSISLVQLNSGQVYLEGIQNKASFELYDSWGKKVKSFELFDGIFEITDGLSAGVYILKSTQLDIKPLKVIQK